MDGVEQLADKATEHAEDRRQDGHRSSLGTDCVPAPQPEPLLLEVDAKATVRRTLPPWPTPRPRGAGGPSARCRRTALHRRADPRRARSTRSWRRRSGCWSRRACRSSSRPGAGRRQDDAPRRRCSTSCRRAIRSRRARRREPRDFDWLPQASELGWPRTRAADRWPRARSARRARPLLADELSDHLPAYTWGAAARIAVRAASIGYGLAGHDPRRFARRGVRDAPPPAGRAHRRRAVAPRRRARAPPRRARPPPGRRGPLRPAGRPATSTATSSGSGRRCSRPGTRRRDAFEHFGWGVTPELAMRVGRRAGDFELETDRRRDFLAGSPRPGVDRRRRPSRAAHRRRTARRRPTARHPLRRRPAAAPN